MLLAWKMPISEIDVADPAKHLIRLYKNGLDPITNEEKYIYNTVTFRMVLGAALP